VAGLLARDRVASAVIEDLVETVVVAAEVGIDVDVVDVGTGTGAAAILASRRGASVIGIDGSQERLDAAAARAVEIGVPIDWMIGGPEDIPCPEESMDRIISVLGMGDADPERSAAEIMRVLRPGGVFVLAGAEGGPWGDREAVRGAFEPYGLELTLEALDGHLLTRGRRARTWPLP
jgi:ubiquinone/menaquinone biosynthesis C-methylase UbiE